MIQIRWTLARTLRRHGQKVPALVAASGVSRNTVYDIVNGKSRAVSLDTVARLLSGLETLTGQPMRLEDVLQREEADPYAAQFAVARPYQPRTFDVWDTAEQVQDEAYWAQVAAGKSGRSARLDALLEDE